MQFCNLVVNAPSKMTNLWYAVLFTTCLSLASSQQVRGSKSKIACENYAKSAPLRLSEGKTVKPGEYPHVVALGSYNKDNQEYRFRCAGSLISESYVITAAHCIVNTNREELKIVRVGSISVPISAKKVNPNIDRDVIGIAVHENYKQSSIYDDIALVKIPKLNFTNLVRPACLHTERDSFRNLYVTSWGVVFDPAKRHEVEKVSMNHISLQECKDFYYRRVKRNLTESQLCAAHNQEDNPCKNPSGATLQYHNNFTWTVVGINSYSISCQSSYPSVFTRIGSYLDWIEKIVWP